MAWWNRRDAKNPVEPSVADRPVAPPVVPLAALPGITFLGPRIDDAEILRRLPSDLRELLTATNGIVAFGGALHVRGACHAPPWHALRRAWTGDDALHHGYPQLRPEDVPFAQDAVGDQFVLRAGVVHRLETETGDLESLELALPDFLAAVLADPDDHVGAGLVTRLEASGGRLRPGQLLNVYPPFCTVEAASGVHLRAVPADERLAFLRALSAALPADRQRLRIEIE